MSAKHEEEMWAIRLLDELAVRPFLNRLIVGMGADFWPRAALYRTRASAREAARKRKVLKPKVVKVRVTVEEIE